MGLLSTAGTPHPLGGIMGFSNVRITHFKCYHAFFRPLNIPESAKSMSWPQIYNRATRSPSGDAHTTHRMRKRRRRHVIMHAFQPLVRA